MVCVVGTGRMGSSYIVVGVGLRGMAYANCSKKKSLSLPLGIGICLSLEGTWIWSSYAIRDTLYVLGFFSKIENKYFVNEN